ncbi:hypothetical protein KCV87_23595 [Actinosynnema pretiosum subsp. pretiosum]|uniref:Uncharacterized protein n=1 Tax=Actinosynnema pretiosum subsp. pretiosum TaxID=103721 RepID=A0AA45R2F7_9PSEU|nr:hypothetical protein APASM_6426 [Actinosynnema pretiosum subsp. pretiosum]QUF02445.1 hypothetical protein KCV87_23595 [Actinosynnema pretiosum subsp. pretiosum]
MFLSWRRGKRDEIITCSCEPDWPELVSDLDGHPVRGLPSPDGSSPMVMMLGLVAKCARCGARYPHGWTVAD